jgi:phytoene dehydrogenase-like protein
VVIGGGANGLVAATALARAGSRVAVVEARPTLGGVLGELEFAPGYRAAPLAPDLGWLPAEVLRGVGLGGRTFREVAPDPSVVAPAADGALLQLFRDPAATAQGLRRLSARDADRWPGFAQLVARLAGVLEILYASPPPLIDATGLGELTGLLRLARRVRGLGRGDMTELLRIVPMAVGELLDEWFESEPLKAALAAGALGDLCQGPRSGGTAFALLHRRTGAPPGGFGPRTVLAAGSGPLIDALAEQARGMGVELRTGSPVVSVAMERERVAGVVLESGEVLRAPEVISSLDPRRTLLELVDPVYLDPEVIDAARHLRLRGARATVLLALERLPELPGSGDGRALGGSFVVAPTLDYLERAYDATKYGEISPEPWLDVRVPSLAQPGLAPGDHHVMVILAQYAPYHLRRSDWESEREALGDRIVSLAGRFLPGLAERVVHRLVLTPPDIERRFGLTEGAVAQGELMLDQVLFMRPFAGSARYALPVPGLFLCGAGAHPGPGVVGGAGWLAAQAVLRHRAKAGAAAPASH